MFSLQAADALHKKHDYFSLLLQQVVLTPQGKGSIASRHRHQPDGQPGLLTGQPGELPQNRVPACAREEWMPRQVLPTMQKDQMGGSPQGKGPGLTMLCLQLD